jgi:hypothetical protein
LILLHHTLQTGGSDVVMGSVPHDTPMTQDKGLRGFVAHAGPGGNFVRQRPRRLYHDQPDSATVTGYLTVNVRTDVKGHAVFEDDDVGRVRICQPSV